jgi:hypothetical protein
MSQCFRSVSRKSCDSLVAQWRPAHKTNANSNIGKNYRVADGDIFANSLAALADPLDTSKKLMLLKERFVSLRKFTMQPVGS